METEEWDNPADRPIPGVELSSKLKYTHSIKPGVTKVELYGLKLAMNTSYPPKIIQNALDMSKRITADRVVRTFVFNNTRYCINIYSYLRIIYCRVTYRILQIHPLNRITRH